MVGLIRKNNYFSLAIIVFEILTLFILLNCLALEPRTIFLMGLALN